MLDLSARLEDERAPRNPASKIDDVVRVRRVGAADSHTVAHSGMKVYLVRTATLVARGAPPERSSGSAFPSEDCPQHRR